MMITSIDYAELLNLAEDGDFVFVHAPYNDTEADYVNKKFSHEALKEHLDLLTLKNIKFVMIDKDTPKIRQLIQGYNIKIITKSQTTELLIWNFDKSGQCSYNPVAPPDEEVENIDEILQERFRKLMKNDN